MIAEVLQREGIEEKEAIRLAACIENERRERIKKGLADARDNGRLRKKVDKNRVIQGLKQGVPVDEVAREQKVSAATLRRRLKEWGICKGWVEQNS
ncbi:MAG: hypothetical protein IBX41_05095 [Methanophagales archaeon]|nr:hypothetical protein [Methanophagales archaeon]